MLNLLLHYHFDFLFGQVNSARCRYADNLVCATRSVPEGHPQQPHRQVPGRQPRRQQIHAGLPQLLGEVGCLGEPTLAGAITLGLSGTSRA